MVKFIRVITEEGTRAWQIYIRLFLKEEEVRWRWKSVWSGDIRIAWFDFTLAAPWLMPNT